MPQPDNSSAFFSSSRATGLRREPEMLLILTDLPTHSQLLYDLTFHAAFADRLFILLQREGKNVQGYERMQQSLAESVQNVVRLLHQLEEQQNISLGLNRPDAKELLRDLLHDLALVKEWMLSENERP